MSTATNHEPSLLTVREPGGVDLLRYGSLPATGDECTEWKWPTRCKGVVRACDHIHTQTGRHTHTCSVATFRVCDRHPQPS